MAANGWQFTKINLSCLLDFFTHTHKTHTHAHNTHAHAHAHTHTCVHSHKQATILGKSLLSAICVACLSNESI